MEDEIQESDVVNKICRTCLSGDEPLTEIFGPNEITSGDKISLCDMLLSVAYVQINTGDGLPEEICQSCSEKAAAAYHFKLQCERADAVLRQAALLPAGPVLLVLPAVTRHVPTYGTPMPMSPVLHFEDSDNDAVTEDTEDIQTDRVCGKPETFACAVCTEIFSERSGLRAHRKTHPPDARHTCRSCGKSFSRIYTLRHHMLTHSEYRAHLCPICGKRFHLAGGLRQHLRCHRGLKPHACAECDKRYRSRHLLREHTRCAHSKDRYNTTCPQCGKKFTAKSTLTAHLRTHTGERAHPCKECGKSFTRAAYLRQHARRHADRPPPKPFRCSYEACSREFSAKASLQIHVRHRHTRERPYACELCPKAFSSHPGLSEHRRVHTGEKPEVCALCNKRFVNKQSLKKHTRLHTGERPYACEACGECFVSSSRRAEHIQCKHGEREHECGACGKRFYLRRTLKAHLRVHKLSAVPEPGSEVTV